MISLPATVISLNSIFSNHVNSTMQNTTAKEILNLGIF